MQEDNLILSKHPTVLSKFLGLLDIGIFMCIFQLILTVENLVVTDLNVGTFILSLKNKTIEQETS